ncbi:WxL protein peptidoglycan domain-containing protein [Weissella confusa]|uniref:DUF916 domain-containing protein n=1 Tax=Weissella confusa TaxID=1583 RepID=UPI0035A3B046
MSIKRLALTGLVVGASLLTVTNVHAAGNDYTVQAVVPATQIDKTNVSYFDMKLNPGQTESLTFNLTNTSNKAITVDISKGTAGTTNGGTVDYAATSGFDKTLPARLGDAIETPDKVSLNPKETKAVNAKITMPDATTSGIYAGGVKFTEEGQGGGGNGKGMQLGNVFSYAIAVLARNSTDGNDVADTLTPNGVTLSSDKGISSINTNVINPKAALLNRLEIVGSVKDSSGQTYMSETQKMMQMAPNSNFDFSMTSNGKEIKAGKYLAKYTAFWSQDANGQYADAKGTRFDYTKTWE